MSDTEGVIIDSEASIDKQYFVGMDIGFENDTTVMAIGHLDTGGVLVIDQILEGEDAFRVPSNQGL